jgi:hypothetical protein
MRAESSRPGQARSPRAVKVCEAAEYRHKWHSARRARRPTTRDNSLNGYNPCFRNGHVDAVKAVLHDTSREIFAEFESTDDSPFGCPTFE